ncbi:cupin domain-containing protein [Acidothermaceae bacterium B102]|nr:cupin domain-containing protein [Acidothermaceae bacterium B102]
MDKPRALVVRAAAGETISAVGVEHVFKLTGNETAGRLGVAHFTVPTGVIGAGPHIHHHHDETFYVLGGVLTVATDDGEIAVLPGDLAYAPRGSVHGFRNAGDVACEALCLYTPPGYEQYFRDVHDAVRNGSEVSPELISELRRRYATEAAD